MRIQMDKVSKNNFEYKKDIENDNIREKIKIIIKRDKRYNLRDLSRTLKKNDAYLQQYLFHKNYYLIQTSQN